MLTPSAREWSAILSSRHFNHDERRRPIILWDQGDKPGAKKRVFVVALVVYADLFRARETVPKLFRYGSGQIQAASRSEFVLQCPLRLAIVSSVIFCAGNCLYICLGGSSLIIYAVLYHQLLDLIFGTEWNRY